jgi:GNAT superfamily N-acetyltransferase
LYRQFEPTDAGRAQRDAAVESIIHSHRTANPLGCLWLIVLNDQPIGYLLLAFGFSLAFAGRDGFLDELFIDPRHRGNGYGTWVLREVLSEAKSLGLHAVHLEVSRGNPKARALYEREGFSDRQDYHLMSCLLAGTGPADKG